MLYHHKHHFQDGDKKCSAKKLSDECIDKLESHIDGVTTTGKNGVSQPLWIALARSLGKILTVKIVASRKI